MQTSFRNLSITWSLTICLLLPTFTRAETAVLAWVQRYNGPANRDESAVAVAVDNNNNVIVAGSSTGSEGFSDYATVKYSGAGLPLWTNRYHGPSHRDDQACAVAVDHSGNVIVTGWSYDSSGLYHDYATIKYSTAGMPLWTNRYDGPANVWDLVSAVVVDGSNSVIVTGYSCGNGSSADYTTIKYSSEGTPLWTNRYDGPASNWDRAYALAVDGSNDVVVTGFSHGGGTSYDYATVKYSSAGVPLWTNRYNSEGIAEDEAHAVTTDSLNNVMVTGGATIKYSSAGVPIWTNWFRGPGNYGAASAAVAADGSNNVIVAGTVLASSFLGDYATIKYSSAGVPIWTNYYNGSADGLDEVSAMAVDAGNNVIVTGVSSGSTSSFDCTTIKYSSAGVPLWTNCYNGPSNGDESAGALALDRSGNVIVTTSSYGSGADIDFATMKYVFVVPSPVMTSLHLAQGMRQVRVDELLQGCTVVVEASTDLTRWKAICTNTTPSSVLFCTDPEASSLPARFYRAFQFP